MCLWGQLWVFIGADLGLSIILCDNQDKEHDFYVTNDKTEA
jgi:hypothetical protein